MPPVAIVAHDCPPLAGSGLHAGTEVDHPVRACDFNRAMQHLNYNYRERDVENETKTEDLLLRCTKGIDVGSVAETGQQTRKISNHINVIVCTVETFMQLRILSRCHRAKSRSAGRLKTVADIKV